MVQAQLGAPRRVEGKEVSTRDNKPSAQATRLFDAGKGKLLDRNGCAFGNKGALAMSGLRALARKARYRNLVIAFFVASVIVSSAGSLVLSIEYFAVFETANRFNPSVFRLTKQNVTEDSRLISVYLRLPNMGSRPVFIFEYGVFLTLNGQFVAQRDAYPALTIEPASNDTLVVQFTVTSGYAQVIIQAEESAQWNWSIRYPMRFRVGWLSVTAAHFQQLWLGIQEEV